jgi:Ni,Fe-hydrogenase III component G
LGLEIGTNPMDMDAIATLLAADFAAALTDVRVQEPDTVVARCARGALKDVARRLKAHPEIGYETLNFVAGVDWVEHLESVYHVYSWKTNTYLELHVEVPIAAAEVDTVCDVWPAADWYDYTIALAGGKTIGAAVIDHPGNPPATWHNPRYVWMINPCIVARGPVTVKQGTPLTLRYRVVTHDGATPKALLDALAKEWRRP